MTRRMFRKRHGPPSFLWFLVGIVAVGATVAGLRLAGSENGRADDSATSPSSDTTPAVPACSDGENLTRHRDPSDWQRTLLDPTYRLEATYEPDDLVSTTRAGFAADFPVRTIVMQDLRRLRRAAARAGLPVEPTFGYRSFQLQASVFQTWVNQVGEERALAVAARPGHSEHQLGTAVDFRSKGEDSVDRTWGESPTGAWMAEHAPRFGFVLSYPKGAKARSCYAYEPWHFRYFGPERAADIRASGLTVREFLWREENAPGGVAAGAPAGTSTP